MVSRAIMYTAFSRTGRALCGLVPIKDLTGMMVRTLWFFAIYLTMREASPIIMSSHYLKIAGAGFG